MNLQLIIFATLACVVVPYPTVKTWSLNELSIVLGNKNKQLDQDMKPYYINALNIIMYALFTGTNQDYVMALALSPSGHKKWTIDELNEGLTDPAYNNTLEKYIATSLNYLMNSKTEKEIEVSVPAQDISTWTLSDIFDAIEDPDTKPELLPYLNKAKKEMGDSLQNGVSKKTISMVTPVGLVPIESGSPRLIPKEYELTHNIDN